jgi:uncharacterized membrane protein YqiK
MGPQRPSSGSRATEGAWASLPVFQGRSRRGSIGGVDEASLWPIAIAAGAAFVVVVGALGLYARALVKAEQGYALVVSKPGGDDVRFGSTVVLPFVHRAEVIDLRSKTLTIERRGKQGVSCRDGIRADVGLTAHLRVNPTAEDVLKVARTIGCVRASEPAVLEQLFASKIAEALETVAAHFHFDQLHRDREAFKDQIISLVGTDLAGYVLDDVVVDLLEQTPLENLDPNNVLDAQGIRAITERTSQERIRRSELELETERQLRRQQHEQRELELELERQLRQRQHELEELVIELERRKVDALGRFRETTGRELGPEELRARLEDGLRAVVERVLDERQRGA